MDHVLVFQFLYVLLFVINSYFTFYDCVLTMFLHLYAFLANEVLYLSLCACTCSNKMCSILNIIYITSTFTCGILRIIFLLYEDVLFEDEQFFLRGDNVRVPPCLYYKKL